MLEVGMRVAYGIHGVCTITGREVRKVDRKNVEYFILEPIDKPGAQFYVPAHNTVALSKLRTLLTLEELDALFDSEETHRDCWIAEENRRKQYYRELLNGGERAALISMIRVLYRHRESQLAAGKKFHMCDETFLSDAQKMLVSEYSAVLEMPKPEIIAYINGKIQK